MKIYLVEIENVKLASNTPTAVIREGVRARKLSEEDAEIFLKMLRCRNLTSHIYEEEVADQIAKDIVGYNEIIVSNVAELKPA